MPCNPLESGLISPRSCLTFMVDCPLLPDWQLVDPRLRAGLGSEISVDQTQRERVVVQALEGKMDLFEYKVVPAPVKGPRAKGVKGTSERFAFALEGLMNDLAVDGWEYFRSDLLPAEERQGLTSKTLVYQNLLVFRRVKDADNAKDDARHAALVQTLQALPAPAEPSPPKMIAPPTLAEGRDFGAIGPDAGQDEDTPALMTAPEPDASFFSSEPLMTAELPGPTDADGTQAKVTALYQDQAEAEDAANALQPFPTHLLHNRAARLRAAATAAE